VFEWDWALETSAPAFNPILVGASGPNSDRQVFPVVTNFKRGLLRRRNDEDIPLESRSQVPRTLDALVWRSS
jgi:hypothetical protein